MRGGLVLAGVMAIAVAAAPRRAAADDAAHADEELALADAEMASGAFDLAARDYGEAYEITKDAAVFANIALANEKDGKCAVAAAYYRRYLNEAHPDDAHAADARARIAACGTPTAANPTPPPTATPTPPPIPTANPNPTPPPTATPTPPPIPTANPNPTPPPIATRTPPPTATPTPTPTATPTPPPNPIPALPPSLDPNASPTPTPVRVVHSHGTRAGWLLVGGAITMTTLGAVLAYAASSAEADVSDLYVGLAGVPPTYTLATQQRYADLLAKGDRYEHLAWGAFSLAGASAIAAGIVFALGRGDDTAVHIAPTATPTSAGLAAQLRF